MEKILSQDEVDALLNGVTGGEVETEPEPVAEEVHDGPVPYDLGNQEWIVRGRMPTLDVVHQQFSRFLRGSLTDLLRRPTEVDVANKPVLKFGEFIQRLPVPAYLQIITMEPLRGYAMIAADARTVYMLVDHFLGGTGQTHVKPEGKDFTVIEQRIMRKVMMMAIFNLEKAWNPVEKIAIKPVRAEMNPQFAAIVLPTDIVLAINVTIELGNEVGDLHLCIPYSMLEPIREKLQASLQHDVAGIDESWVRRFSNQLCDAHVSLTVHLGSTQISVEDLMNFSVGDVIVLDQPTDEHLVATVEGTPKFLGSPGVTKASQSFQVGSIMYPKKG